MENIIKLSVPFLLDESEGVTATVRADYRVTSPHRIELTFRRVLWWSGHGRGLPSAGADVRDGHLHLSSAGRRPSRTSTSLRVCRTSWRLPCSRAHSCRCGSCRRSRTCASPCRCGHRRRCLGPCIARQVRACSLSCCRFVTPESHAPTTAISALPPGSTGRAPRGGQYLLTYLDDDMLIGRSVLGRGTFIFERAA